MRIIVCHVGRLLAEADLEAHLSALVAQSPNATKPYLVMDCTPQSEAVVQSLPS